VTGSEPWRSRQLLSGAVAARSLGHAQHALARASMALRASAARSAASTAGRATPPIGGATSLAEHAERFQEVGDFGIAQSLARERWHVAAVAEE
jgi:hypothetical protein